MTMDPFNALVSSGSNALAVGANMMAQQSQANAQRTDQRAAREQQMLQFMLSQDAGMRQERSQERQTALVTRQQDRQLAAQREESAFARLNATLDRQLKMNEMESQERDRAFQRSLQAQQADIQLRMQTLQLQQVEGAANAQEFMASIFQHNANQAVQLDPVKWMEGMEDLVNSESLPIIPCIHIRAKRVSA